MQKNVNKMRHLQIFNLFIQVQIFKLEVMILDSFLIGFGKFISPSLFRKLETIQTKVLVWTGLVLNLCNMFYTPFCSIHH